MQKTLRINTTAIVVTVLVAAAVCSLLALQIISGHSHQIARPFHDPDLVGNVAVS